MAPAQKDTLRKLQAEAYLSVLRAVAASELDWVRAFDDERENEEGRKRCIVFFFFADRRLSTTALSLSLLCRMSSLVHFLPPSDRRSVVVQREGRHWRFSDAGETSRRHAPGERMAQGKMPPPPPSSFAVAVASFSTFFLSHFSLLLPPPPPKKKKNQHQNPTAQGAHAHRPSPGARHRRRGARRAARQGPPGRQDHEAAAGGGGRGQGRGGRGGGRRWGGLGRGRLRFRCACCPRGPSAAHKGRAEGAAEGAEGAEGARAEGAAGCCRGGRGGRGCCCCGGGSGCSGRRRRRRRHWNFDARRFSTRSGQGNALGHCKVRRRSGKSFVFLERGKPRQQRGTEQQRRQWAAAAAI